MHCGRLRLVFVCSRLEWLGIKHTDIEDEDLAIPTVSCSPSKNLRRWGAVYLRLPCCSGFRVSSGHSACTIHAASAQDCWIPLSQADNKKCAQLLKSKEQLWPGDWLDQLRSVQRAGTGPFAGDFSGSLSFVPFREPRGFARAHRNAGATCCSGLVGPTSLEFFTRHQRVPGPTRIMAVTTLSLRVFCRNESGAGNSEPT